MTKLLLNKRLKTSKPPKAQGFTLVELIVVMSIGVIIAAVAFSIYRVNSAFYLQNDDDIRLQQNLRLALYAITRDLRMAGGGFYVLGPGVKLIQAYAPMDVGRKCGEPIFAEDQDYFFYCDDKNLKGVRAIFGEDGGENKSDFVTIFRADPEFSGVIGQVAAVSGDTLEVKNGAQIESVSPGDILALAKGQSVMIFETQGAVEENKALAKIILKKEGRFTGPHYLPPDFIAEGALIYNLKDVTIVTYYVDEVKSELLAVYHDKKSVNKGETAVKPALVASQIEDLQLYYFFENEAVDPSRLTLTPAISSARLKDNNLRALGVGLTGKSLRKLGSSGQSRPALFNRKASSTKDNYNHSSLELLIQLRNYEK
ncbi:MAG: prepilin-type N-terminal cleavage/methylation domain-containing protein [Deltaproteobacteria bacterium]|jgi:prepilin-type N-terminal cleavage/methylation domain-containing protein|nr:prepilin-type N-terminal cleavage/methylation domain-containing protein [Deltaproteobacteria bacterium]